MLVLASSGNGVEIIFSGVLAAVISGGVSLIGNYYQNKNAKESLNKQEENSRKSLEMQRKNNEASIRAQKDIANLEKNERLFYQNQIKWSNEIREHLAKIIGLIPQYNDLFVTIGVLNDAISEMQLKPLNPTSKDDKIIYATPEDHNMLLEKNEKATDAMVKIGVNLQEEIGIVRMLLFNANNYEMKIENRLNEISNYVENKTLISLSSEEHLIMTAKDYFKYELRMLKQKTK